MMTKPPMGDFYKENGMNYRIMFDYNWEAMLFKDEADEQIRGMTSEEVLKEIDSL